MVLTTAMSAGCRQGLNECYGSIPYKYEFTNISLSTKDVWHGEYISWSYKDGRSAHDQIEYWKAEQMLKTVWQSGYDTVYMNTCQAVLFLSILINFLM